MTRGTFARVVAVAVATLLSVGVVTGLGGIGTQPAQATAYRYWTYWHGGPSGWTFSTVGASGLATQGSVEGWRFAVSGVAGSTAPRTSASFAAICGSTLPPGGSMRVAIIVDYGTSADAPPGEHPPRGIDQKCVELPVGKRGIDVLRAYGSFRTDNGLICGIDGYPRTECGAVVAPLPTTPAPRPTTPKAPPPTGHTTSGSPPGGSAAPTTSRSAGATSVAPTASGNAAAPASSSAGSSVGPVPGDTSGAPAPITVGQGQVTPAAASTGGSPAGVIVVILVLAGLVGAGLLAVRARRGTEGTGSTGGTGGTA
jgi:hypothetical protein